MKSFRKHIIPFYVFTTGACVLIIEILATRILAPYFGNTIFCISSVLGVVLGALSIGYFIGGKLADKYPQEKLFYYLVASSGACTILLHLAGIAFLNKFGYTLSMIEGPLITSLILFFPQNIILGMLSPFAVILQAKRKEAVGLGSISGEIFFWSTLGSIAGSMLAGFVLIPNFGINRIMFIVGLLLIAMGIVPLLKFIQRPSALLFIAALAIFSWHKTDIVNSSLPPMHDGNIIYETEALYQKITIYDGIYNDQPARFLLQDRNPSAAAFLNSDQLPYGYTKYYSLYHIFNPNIKDALMIGGGAYSVPMALLQELPDAKVDVAEIEPSLFDIVKAYFKVNDNPNLHNIIQDGRRLLADSDKKYDLIFSDAYSSIYSTPGHLTTQEFFSLAKSRLHENGIFIANVVGSLKPTKISLALSEIKTFKSIFNNSYFFAVESSESQDLQNIIFIGYNSSNRLDLNDPKIKGHQNLIIRNLHRKEIAVDNIDLSKYPLLTDDFSPVEYFSAKSLQ